MTGTPTNTVIDAFASVQCGQSVVLSLFGKNVLISAGPTPVVPGTGPGSPVQDPAPVEVPTARPPILEPVVFPDSSVATIIKSLGESVPVIALDDFLQRPERSLPADQGKVGETAILRMDVGHLFEIEGVGSVVLPAQILAPSADDLADVDLGDNGF